MAQIMLKIDCRRLLLGGINFWRIKYADNENNSNRGSGFDHWGG